MEAIRTRCSRTRFPAVIEKFWALRNYALFHNRLWDVCENDPYTRHTANAAKSDETGQKVSQFPISINSVSSNGYSHCYLRHALSIAPTTWLYRPKFLHYYRKAHRAKRVIWSLKLGMVPRGPPFGSKPNSFIMAVIERSTGMIGDCCLMTCVQM